MNVVDDIDLMMYLDGELDDVRMQAIAAELQTNAQLKARFDALSIQSEALRTFFETEVDGVQLASGSLWEGIEKELDGSAGEPESFSVVASQKKHSFWKYALTGVVAGVAAAMVVLFLSKPGQTNSTEVNTPQVADGQGKSSPKLILTSQPTEVESLDVASGGGTLIFLSADDESEQATPVIWISEEDLSEGDEI